MEIDKNFNSTTDKKIEDNRQKVALSIAGSDSSAGAGIQADMKSAAALGCYMATAITAITAQNSMGVTAIEPTPSTILTTQIEAVMSDMRVEAIKTGMIPNIESVKAVLECIDKYTIENIVVDPVIVSTSGATLIDKTAIDCIIEKLFPLATIVTPNSVECGYITGVKICSSVDFDRAASKFELLGSKYLLLKGGHIDGKKIVDVLYDLKRGNSYNFEFERVDTMNTHGTGCSLSSSIAASMAMGYNIVESVERAENFVHKAIFRGKDMVLGKGHGSIAHFEYLR
ncbi:MAG: bifunctional hydroxymethylpyrimidine kinase/phosphomethylpyrimidine kinase [Rikenellaceae bacterium]